MKSFKQYLNDKKSVPLPVLDTWFGCHSLSDSSGYPMLNTTFGDHDRDDEYAMSEANDALVAHKRSPATHTDIHENIAPMDLSGASNRELAAVVDYTNDSSMLNKNLMHRHLGQEYSKAYDPTINALTSLLSRHETSEPTHVYTGIKESPASLWGSEFPKGPIVAHEPKFISTSTSLLQARGFSKRVSDPSDANHGIELAEDGTARHILQLHLPDGTQAMSVRDHSSMPEENEILVNRGSDIEVHPNPTHLGNNIHLWKARLVRHNPARLK